MIRLPTGHVAVSIVEFGPSFTVPANHRCFHSQAWTSDTAHLSEHALPHAFEFSTMGPVATLALTALCLRWLGGQTDHDGSGTPTSTPTSSRNSEAPRTARATSLLACTAGAINDCGGRCDDVQPRFEADSSPGRQSSSTSLHPRPRSLPGPRAGTLSALHSWEDIPWSEQALFVPPLRSVRTGADDTANASSRSATLERHSGVRQVRFLRCSNQEAGDKDQESGNCSSIVREHIGIKYRLRQRVPPRLWLPRAR